ncbi:NAD(P)H-hydrate dehydratase [Aquimarina sp. ERC-38]|uniref:NAD(P)H-hydrate dehydratase n=1 Tax=Aquimarina sp. ERC-38 TaxID=2949996 RepID=UPI002247D1FA|nr:NAD(P)H-hydrate dehydratase [Aquimarina sp. ERC-38]UZO79495.1 NAD(P)H-hydrate dehydratase [Aquimarina sp. ERC-38]
MKIFSTDQIKKLDLITIEKQKIKSTDLMERAATRLFDAIHDKLQNASIPIHIFCGLGNNGGDGLVLARLLQNHGYSIHTYIVNFSDNRSADFLVNYGRLKEISEQWPIQIKSKDDFPKIPAKDLVIDAIFGIGLNRPPVPWVSELITYINSLKCFTISIDVPSGLYVDVATPTDAKVIGASVVLTFQTPKLVFYLPETGKYIQELEVLDIELDKEEIQKTKGIAHLLGKNEVLALYQPRFKFDHKGNYGHCLLIGGSYGMIGSISLTTEAALRVGSGLVTAYIPGCGYNILQTKVPEAMVITDTDKEKITSLDQAEGYKVVGIGMGMGTHPTTKRAFSQFLKTYQGKLVVDADAINLLAEHKELCAELPKETVLTPHPGELRRLIGEWKDDFEKIALVKAFSKKYNCIVVIKGAHTLTIFKEEVYINTTGNPGMATAGSGDVLTGIITGLIAQNYDPLIAAVFGVYLHGLAGDLGVEKWGYQALLARNLVLNIGPAYLSLFQKT